MVRERGDQLLLSASVLFAVAVVIHNGDHVRRGADALATDVFVAGSLAVVPEVAVVVLALARHRLAPLAALAVGASLAPGYLLVHFLPARSWLSDSLTSATDVSPISWFAASFEVVAAVALAVTGLLVLRRRGGLASAARPHAEQAPLREGLLHPLALGFLLFNLAVLAISFAQL